MSIYLCLSFHPPLAEQVVFPETLIRRLKPLQDLCVHVLKTFYKEEARKNESHHIITGQPHAGHMNSRCLFYEPCFPLDSPFEQKNSDDYDDDEDNSQNRTHDPEHLWLLRLCAHAAVERHQHGLREGTGCKRALLKGGSTFSQLLNVAF